MGNLGGVEADGRPWHGQPCSAALTLPPLATLFFVSRGLSSHDRSRGRNEDDNDPPPPRRRRRATPWPACLPEAAARDSYEMTDFRAKPAVSFGGKTRIIDFALSNGSTPTSGASACDPVQGAQPDPAPAARLEFPAPERNESFDILPASQRVSETQWYKGTADAVYQNIDAIESDGPSTS